jgi:hypothetical protein
MRIRVMTRRLVLALCVFALSTATGASDDKKPSITLRATPSNGISPLRVVLTAVIHGGPNDYQDFYCPNIEWDWDDGTKSESKSDCEPYEPGKSEIKRSYTVDHRFETPYDYKEYRVQFRLKQKNKTVGSASVSIRVQPGIGRD